MTSQTVSTTLRTATECSRAHPSQPGALPETDGLEGAAVIPTSPFQQRFNVVWLSRGFYYDRRIPFKGTANEHGRSCHGHRAPVPGSRRAQDVLPDRGKRASGGHDPWGCARCLLPRRLEAEHGAAGRLGALPVRLRPGRVREHRQPRRLLHGVPGYPRTEVHRRAGAGTLPSPRQFHGRLQSRQESRWTTREPSAWSSSPAARCRRRDRQRRWPRERSTTRSCGSTPLHSTTCAR